MDSGFREINVTRAWRVYLATGFDFRERSGAGLGSIGPQTLPSASPNLATLQLTLLCRKDEEDYFSRNFVCIYYNNKSPHGKFRLFLFPFSSKFPDLLNFTPFVLYIPGYPVDEKK